MTLIEAGIIVGVPVGAIIGGVIGKSHGVLGIASGSVAGLFLGGLAGWLYTLTIIFLMSTIAVVWRSIQKCPDELPAQSDMDRMTSISIRGVFIGALVALVCWFNFGWLQALTAAFTIALITAFLAVARCELR